AGRTATLRAPSNKQISFSLFYLILPYSLLSPLQPRNTHSLYLHTSFLFSQFHLFIALSLLLQLALPTNQRHRPPSPSSSLVDVCLTPILCASSSFAAP